MMVLHSFQTRSQVRVVGAEAYTKADMMSSIGSTGLLKVDMSGWLIRKTVEALGRYDR